MQIIYYFRDIITVINLRLKLLRASKSLVGLFFVFGVLASAIMMSYDEAAYEKSSIPIGIIDMDKTTMTKEIIKEIDGSDIIRVVTGSKDELLNKLRKNEIYSLFVYEKGFTDRLLSLETDEIITDYYPSNNMLTKVMSDVVLAGLLDELCYTYCFKSYYTNTKLYTSPISMGEYREYMTSLYKHEDRTLSFKFNIMNNNTQKDETKFNTILLYKEIVFALCMVICIIVTMIIGNILIKDSKVGANNRFILSNISEGKIVLGDFIATTLVSYIFSLYVVLIQIYKIKFNSITEIGKFLLLILAFDCTISMLYIMMARLLDDYVAYQLIGSIVVLAIGVTGALYILGFMINNRVINIAMYTPLGALINGYKNLITAISIEDNIVILLVESVIMYIITYIRRWRLSL